MKIISDIKITGIDTARPPKIRKEPYIDLVFKLSEQANKSWCQDFNMMFEGSEFTVKIDSTKGLYIETWIREMGEIPEHLEMLKKKVAECNRIYNAREIANAQAAMLKNQTLMGEGGAQELLNNIIAGLKFD
jgi:hypothetical protein